MILRTQRSKIWLLMVSVHVNDVSVCDLYAFGFKESGLPSLASRHQSAICCDDPPPRVSAVVS